MYFLGLILVWGLVVGEGKSQQVSSQGDYQALAASQNLLLAPQSTSQTQQEQQTQNAERRLSLEDFFMNRNNQQQQQEQQTQVVQRQLQEPLLPQFQVQQSDPNSVLFTRDTQFPSRNGGVLSRLLMLRRILRLRRWARRLSIIPRLVRLGVQSASLRQAGSEPQPVIVAASDRIGRSYNDEPYDPRDYVFGNKAYSYNNTPSSQERYKSRDLPKQETDTYSRDSDRYYDTVHDLPYDLYDNQDAKKSNNYGADDAIAENQNKYRDTYNTNSDDKGMLTDYYATQNIRQNQENTQQQYLNYPNNNQNPNFSVKQNELLSSLSYPQNSQQDSYQKNQQVYEGNNQQDNKANSYIQNQNAQLNNDQHRKSPESNGNHGNQAQEDQHQLELLRQQQIQLLREQQLLQLLREQQILLEKERQQHLQQQGNLYQQQNQNQQQSQIESEAPFPNYPAQTYNQHQQSSYEKTDKNNYEKPLVADTSNVGGSATRLGSGGNIIGVGVNVGIKPPAIDVAVTKPVSPVIKPLPPISSILHKPVAAPAAEEHLVPLGFLPKPLLNLKGRVFFGAEVGKGVKVGR